MKFTEALFKMAKLETTKMSFNKSLVKLWHIHTIEHYSAMKISELLIHTTWIDLKDMLGGKKSQKIAHYIFHLCNILRMTKL